MIKKIKHIPDLLLQPLRATNSDLALLRIPAEVSKALKVNVSQEMPVCEPALDVESILEDFAPDSVNLFKDKQGRRYPCWLEGDENLGDDWLTAANYYPHYFRIYKHIGQKFKEPRLLEFGVRSGYSAVVFAKAMEGMLATIPELIRIYTSRGVLKRHRKPSEFLGRRILISGFFCWKDFRVLRTSRSPFSIQGHLT